MKTYEIADRLAKELAAAAGPDFSGKASWCTGVRDTWEIILLRFDAQAHAQECRIAWVRIPSCN